MERRTLGPSGLIVSAYALGAMTFGNETDEDEAYAMLDAFVEAGGLVIDVADVYVAGASERIVGRWLADRGLRDEVVLATKARFPVGDEAGPNAQGLSRTHLTRAIDASLERLGVEHVDLYQVHAWDPLTPVEEWLTALDDLVRAGKVGHIGVSNLTGWQLQRAALTARHLGLAPIVSLQPQYNLLSREIEWELVPACEAEGIGMLPWSPLGGGWLTGKYRRDERPTGATRLGEDPGAGWRPTTSATRSGPTGSSTGSARWPTRTGRRPARSRSRGSPRSRRSTRRSWVHAPSSNWRTTSALPSSRSPSTSCSGSTS